jgi:hypothetical protein
MTTALQKRTRCPCCEGSAYVIVWHGSPVPADVFSTASTLAATAHRCRMCFYGWIA